MRRYTLLVAVNIAYVPLHVVKCLSQNDLKHRVVFAFLTVLFIAHGCRIRELRIHVCHMTDQTNGAKPITR